MQTYLAHRLSDITFQVRHLHEQTSDQGRMSLFGKDAFLKGLQLISGEAQFLALTVTRKRVDLIISNYAAYSNASQMKVALEAIEQDMRHELEAVKFIHIPFCKLDYLDWQKLFPKSSLLYTPENYDMEHAASCFAVDSYTAAVFHLVRLLEKGLRKMENGLEIAEEKDKNKQTWGSILGRIGKAIANRDDNPPPGWDCNESKFFSDGRAFLAAIKQAWRDDQIHSSRNYDPAETKVIFDATILFMEHLTTRFTTLVIV